MSGRQDLSSSLVHLTRKVENEETTMSAIDVLIKIIREKKLTGSDPRKAFIHGNQKAVCFQDAPLYSIAQNLAFERKFSRENKTRHRYSGCGLVFSKYYIFQSGGRPVIYDKPEDAKKYLSSEADYYRIVSFDMSNPDNVVDWSHEREWRLAGDFEFRADWVAILLETRTDYKEFISKCSLPENVEILGQVCGIIVLDALLM
ncbi:MAG: hypothetical protein M3T96_07175 [Acidobacteriota bacterium]|nr:hypothetical protein [Acidobacteriota bacterium]